MKKVMILFIGNSQWMGGVATYVRNLSSALYDQNYNAKIFDNSLCHGETWWKQYLRIVSHLAYIVSNGRIGQLLAIDSVFRIFKTALAQITHFDIIHTQDAYMTYFVKKYFPSSTVIQTVHGTDYEHNMERICADKGLKAVVKKYSGYNNVLLTKMSVYENQGFMTADHLITVDSNQARLVKEKTGRYRGIDVIYNAVDVEKLKNLSECAPHYKSAKPYFLMLRRFAPKNGVAYGIKGFLEWVNQKDIELLLAGAGSQKDELVEICRQHVNGKKVVFLGEVNYEKTPALIKNAIATIVPSVPVGGVTEATSLAALESLALGVPVIASNIGGLTEIDNGTKIMNLVRPGESHDISEAMENIYQTFLENKIDRQRLKSHILDNFDTSVWCQKIVNVYEKTLQERRTRLIK